MYTWTEIQPAGDTDASWVGLAISSDGQYMLALAYGGRVYRSANAGDTWAETQPDGDSNGNWLCCGMSANGRYQIVGGDQCAYISDDYGATWGELCPEVYPRLPQRNWESVALSSDGSRIVIAGTYTGQTYGNLYLSSDYGATFDEVTPAGAYDYPWDCCASSSTGQYMIAGYLAGRLYVSDDYGATWTEVRPIDDDDYDWDITSVSADGKYMVSCVNRGFLYASSDYGVTWSAPGGGGASGTGISSTGQYAVATIDSDGLYISSDYLSTWDAQTVDGEGVPPLWLPCAINGSGERVLAAIEGGRVYLGYEDHADTGDSSDDDAPSFNVDQVTDHTAQALNLLIEQYKRKDRIEALLSSLTDRIQEAENMLYAMFEAFLLDYAVGSQLDILGAVVQEERGSSNDTEYRAFIKARIAINRSSGRIPELLNILSLIAVSGAKFQVVDYGNASMVVYQDADPNAIAGPSAATFIDILKQAKAGGVNVQFVYSEYSSGYRFTLASGNSLETSTTLGLADVLQTTGGRLSGVVT